MSAASDIVVTATASLDLPKALGNVREYAQHVKGAPTLADARVHAGRAIENLQDQIDELIFALKNKIKVKLSLSDANAGLRIAEPYPWATIDPPTPIATGEEYRHPNFGLKGKKLSDLTGRSTPQFLLSGRAVVNLFSEVTDAPVVTLSYTPTGGTIPGGVTYTVMVWAVDAAGDWTPGGLASIFVPADTDTNTISATVTFADPANDSGWAAISPFPAAGWYGPNVEAIAVGGTAVTFAGIGELNTPVPDELFDHFRVEARTAYKLGIGGAPIAAVAGDTVTIDGAAFSGDEFVGRTLAVYAMKDPTNPLPICNVPVTGNTADTITCTGAGLAAILHVGDNVLVRAKATTFSATTIGDAKFVNDFPGGQATTGLTPDAHVGQLALIVNGTGRLTRAVPIASNTTTTLTTAAPFDVTPDETSEFIVISSTVDAAYTSGQLRFSALTADSGVVLPLTVGNQWIHYFIQVFTQTAAGLSSDPRWSPWRDIFTPGYPDGIGLGPPQISFTVGYGAGGTPEDIPLGGTSELFTVDVPGTVYAHRVKGDSGPLTGDTVFGISVFKGVAPATPVFLTAIPPTFPDGTAADTDVVTTDLESGTLPLELSDRIFLSVDSVGAVPGQRAVVELWWKPFDLVPQ